MNRIWLGEWRRKWLSICLLATSFALAPRPGFSADDAAGDESEPVALAMNQARDRTGGHESVSPTATERSTSANSNAGAAELANKPSDAERISRLNRSIESDRKRLTELKAEIDRPDSDYTQAEEEFERLDAEVDELKENFAAQKEGATAEELAKAKHQLDEHVEERNRAEQRFELEIEERKALQEQIESLEEKVAKDQAALDKLRGLPAAKRSADIQESDVGDADASGRSGTSAGAEPVVDDRKGGSQEETATATRLMPESAEVSDDGDGASMVAEEEEVDEELAAAAEQAKEKQAAAVEAEDEARSIADRIAILQANVAVARTLRENSLRKVDNTDGSVRSLEAAFRQGMADGLPAGELELLRARLVAAQDRFKEARAESRDRASRLDELQSELANLQTEQIHALQQAEAMRQEAQAAQKIVADLQNPLALRNVLQWLLDHGPKILTILAAMGMFIWFSRMLENRLVDLMARRGSRGSVEDRENRAKTLVGVFHNAASMLIICGGALMIFDEVGIPVAPLMGGAAVLGLAVAFGAQSLIKDFFTGFMILLEQQFMVNDVVKIGDISGQVERITLRMTVLRDLEGRVHFIPHGQIGSTTNLTHGWSRAVFDIAVAYTEDADRVMNVLMDIGRGLRRDPEFGPLILEDPVMLGIDALGESSVQIKFYFKTRPLRQWPVKREMLRRIKNTFDELSIEIPYPHRTIVHRYEGAAGQMPPQDASRDWHQQVA